MKKLLVALALSALLCFVMAVPAMADYGTAPQGAICIAAYDAVDVVATDGAMEVYAVAIEHPPGIVASYTQTEGYGDRKTFYKESAIDAHHRFERWCGHPAHGSPITATG